MFVWKRELERILRQHHTTVDAVITTTSANGALSLAKAHGLRTASIVQAYEDFGWQVPNGTALERLAGMRRRWSTGRFTGSGLDAADVVIANSTFMARAIRERVTSRPKMQVLYPPLDLPMQRRATKWGPARSVGFVNRAGKNLPFVLELARKLPGLAFNVFGTVPAPQSSFPRNLVLRGWEANRHSMYGSSDTWIVPSSWEEPFGLVAIESLSQGCRLAVSRRGGLPEAAGPHGRIFERLDVNEWAMWLQAPASSPIESAERDLSAHLEQFALQTFVKRGHEMFEEWL